MPQAPSPDVFLLLLSLVSLSRRTALNTSCMLATPQFIDPAHNSHPNPRPVCPTAYSIPPLGYETDIPNTARPRMSLRSSAPTLLHAKPSHISKRILLAAQAEILGAVFASIHSLPPRIQLSSRTHWMHIQNTSRGPFVLFAASATDTPTQVATMLHHVD